MPCLEIGQILIYNIQDVRNAHLLTSLALVNVILFKREALSIHVD